MLGMGKVHTKVVRQVFSNYMISMNGAGPIATNISINIYMGIARSMYSGHIIQVMFHCAGVIMCYCVKHDQHA